MNDLPVIVIGAGPVGLAAAAHLRRRGIRSRVLEAGESVGSSILEWGHVRLFSPWRYDVDRVSAQLLDGWDAPDPEALPTGRDLVERYLRPLARHLDVQLGARVTAITRANMDKVRTRDRASTPFVVRIGDEEIMARGVIDASGTWRMPNPLGASGLPAIGEMRFASRISYGIPNIGNEGGSTLVVGAGHSAASSILTLASLEANVVWMTRSDDAKRVLGGGEADG